MVNLVIGICVNFLIISQSWYWIFLNIVIALFSSFTHCLLIYFNTIRWCHIFLQTSTGFRHLYIYVAHIWYSSLLLVCGSCGTWFNIFYTHFPLLQQDNILVVHLIGAALAFLGGAIYAWLQCYLSYKLLNSMCSKLLLCFRIFCSLLVTVFLIGSILLPRLTKSLLVYLYAFNSISV